MVKIVAEIKIDEKYIGLMKEFYEEGYMDGFFYGLTGDANKEKFKEDKKYSWLLSETKKRLLMKSEEEL